MTSVSEYIVGLVYRQLEEMEATDAAVKAGLVGRRSQRGTGPSVVFSVRLDRTELEALERAAASREIKPSALARNLIRAGLMRQRDEDIARAFEQLQDAVADLGSMLGEGDSG